MEPLICFYQCKNIASQSCWLKFPILSRVKVFQFSKYWKNSSNHAKNMSLMFLYGLRNHFNLILWSLVFLTLRQRKNLSIIKHRFAVAATSAEPVTKSTFLTVSLNTWAANLMFITVYRVTFTCSYFSFSTNFSPRSNFHNTGKIYVTTAG